MEIGAIIIIMLVGIVLILTFYVIGVYNRLVDARNKVEDKFKQIDIEIDKVIDIIPTLVNVVKENTKYEDKIINEVLVGTTLVVDSKDINERIKFFTSLNKILNNLFNLSKNYPELKKNKIFINFKKSLKETEDKINYASAFYNDSVLEYNNLRNLFPLNIVSSVFKIKEINYYKIDK